MKRLVVFFAYISCWSVPSNLGAQTIPAEVPDFDRPVAYSIPLLATLVKSYGDQNRVSMIPNLLAMETRVDGAPALTLFYNRKTGSSYLTVNVRVGMDEERLAKALDDIRKELPDVRMDIAQPLQSEFKILVPGSNSGAAVVSEIKTIGPNEFALTFVVDDIFRRIFVQPYSYKSDLFSIRYEGTFRGVMRDDTGIPKLGNRVYSVGSSFSGYCALYPQVVVEISSGKAGCEFPDYSGDKIEYIQKKLARLGLYKSKIDGSFGPNTHRAIQRFQSRENMIMDGIPTDDIWERLKRIR